MTQNTQNPNPRAAKAPLWMKLTLGVSLALNLLVIGAVVGHRADPDRRSSFQDGQRDDGKRAGFRQARDSASMRGAGPLGRALSREDKRAIGKALRENGARFGDVREGLRETHGAIEASLRAVPFDRATLEALLAAQQAQGVEMAQTGQQLLLDRISEMSDAQREAFADRFAEQLPKRGRR